MCEVSIVKACYVCSEKSRKHIMHAQLLVDFMVHDCKIHLQSLLIWPSCPHPVHISSAEFIIQYYNYLQSHQG